MDLAISNAPRLSEFCFCFSNCFLFSGGLEYDLVPPGPTWPHLNSVSRTILVAAGVKSVRPLLTVTAPLIPTRLLEFIVKDTDLRRIIYSVFDARPVIAVTPGTPRLNAVFTHERSHYFWIKPDPFCGCEIECEIVSLDATNMSVLCNRSLRRMIYSESVTSQSVYWLPSLHSSHNQRSYFVLPIWTCVQWNTFQSSHGSQYLKVASSSRSTSQKQSRSLECLMCTCEQ